MKLWDILKRLDGFLSWMLLYIMIALMWIGAEWAL